MILCTALLAVAAPTVAQDRIPWITDLREARDLAERQNRLVLLHFWSDSCIPCKQVERNVFNQPEFIRALTTGYVPVKINATQQPQLADFYKIERVPTDVIVTPEGREVQRFQSLQDSNQYIAMLDGIRAQASVGAYPISPNVVPTANTRPQQDTASVGRYGSYTPSQNETSRYGQPGYGQSSAEQSSSTPANPGGLAPGAYSNQLGQSAAPQHQELAPRYANPYAQETPQNSNTVRSSRYGQPTSSYDNDANRPSGPQHSVAPAPQRNEFAAPNTTYGGADDKPAPQTPDAYVQSAQSQIPNTPAPQSQYEGRGFSQQPAPQVPVAHAPTTQPPQQNPSQPQISLEGYCPVTLVQNRVWTPGDKKWGAVHEGRVYLFAGPEQQQQFLANPHVFAPLMAGYDPVRFAETGQLVPGRREFGLYIDEPGPIALFADEAALERFHANSSYYFNVIRQAKLQQSSGQFTR